MHADQPLQHFAHVGDQGIEIENLGLQDLLAAESEQLMGQGSGALAGFSDFLGALAQRIVGRKAVLDGLAVADDDARANC